MAKLPRGWSLLVLGVLLFGLAFFANLARNPNGSLGKTSFGEWAQRSGPVPTKPSRTTDNGAQLCLYASIAGFWCITVGVILMVRKNKSGWDL